MQWKKLLAMGMVAVMTAAFVSGCGSNSAKNGGSSGSKKIVVGLDDNFPPMGFVDENNKIVGFDVELAAEAAKRLKCEVEFKPIDWASKEAELKSGRIDALWNGLEIMEKRKENMLFSEPYMNDRQMLFRAKGRNEDIKGEEGLKGKIVATQSGGGTAEDYLDTNTALQSSFKEYKKYPDYISAFMDLENGRIDAILCDEIIGRYYMSKHPDKIEAVDTAVGEVSTFGIGFAKDNQALRDEVQKVLDEMKADGTMAKISEKWFGKDITK